MGFHFEGPGARKTSASCRARAAGSAQGVGKAVSPEVLEPGSGGAL